MSTFLVTPHDTSRTPIEVEADSAERDGASGYVNFYEGTGDAKTLVGSFVNVSFHKTA